MMVAAMHRIELHVIQGVVHPAEVPFEPETEAAAGWRTGHPGKIGGLFRHGDRARRLFAKDAVGVAQKLNGFQILPPAVFVGDPLSRLAAVIAIDHRGHRVDPQRIDAEAFDPVQRVTHQVVADFPTSVVVDQGIPVLVIPSRGSLCSYSEVPSNEARAKSSAGKWPGTQSRMTFSPAACAALIK